MYQRNEIVKVQEVEVKKYLGLNNMKEAELSNQDWENIRFNVGWRLTH